MQDLIQFHEKPIRHMEEEGVRWFVVRDVCDALEISWRGTETTKVCDPSWVRYRASGTVGGQQEVVICTDRGMLAIGVAHSSRFRTEFINWFYDKVLPVLQGQQKLPMLPPPSLEDRFNSIVAGLPVSVGVKHPGRIIGKNRKKANRLNGKLKRLQEAQDSVELEIELWEQEWDR